MVTWFLLAGALFLLMSLGGALLKRLPLTAAVLYLFAGLILGPHGVGLVLLDPVAQAEVVERLTEVGVLVSLFTTGLKLRLPLAHPDWRIPVGLATVSMALTVALVAGVGVLALGLPLGAAVLLGAILAPTDPVLASDVQVAHALDRDRVRFSLTAEAGLNDGTAFPFVVLGLGLLGLHDIGAWGWRWLAVDVAWAVGAALAVGWGVGTGVGRLALALRRWRTESLGLDDFLGLGVIALAYGIAVGVHAYGFLAVFAAGLSLRSIERRSAEPDAEGASPHEAPAHMLRELVGFNERLERIGEIGIVVLLGATLSSTFASREGFVLAAAVLIAIRPLSILLATRAASARERALVAWFGIRGVGSLYYLSWAIGRGLDEPLAQRLTGIVLTVVAVSIVVHGVSVTPLMSRFSGPAKQTAS